jgi:hypothetical protein
LSSSNLMGRQISYPIGPIVVPEPTSGPPTSSPPTSSPPTSGPPSHDSTMDCESKSKSQKDDGKTNVEQYDYTGVSLPVNSNPNPTSTAPGPGPAPVIARRRFRSPMRRDRGDRPSIFERDDASSTAASENPITVGDIIESYLRQRAAARKRAPSPRTSRNFN